MMFGKIITFVMTGTGNSYKVGMWFTEVAQQLGLQTKMHHVKTDPIYGVPDEQTLCVFTLPTHGFTAPWLIIKHILGLPSGRGASAVVLPSRAGIRIKGVSFPGLEGTAGYLLAVLLFFKGYKVRGVMGVDMPSNWTALHWGLSKENSEFIISCAEPRVKHFAKSVLSGKVYFDGMIPLQLGICLIPISVGYLVLAQLMLSKLFFTSPQCVGCGLCARICPKKAITMTGKIKQRPYWSYSCDSCMACMNYCPYKAIQASPIFANVFYYLTTIPVATYLLQNLFVVSFPWFPIAWAGTQYVYILTFVFLTSLLLHRMLGGRVFSLLMTRLSHTYYFSRYHAPGVTIKDLQQK